MAFGDSVSNSPALSPLHQALCSAASREGFADAAGVDLYAARELHQEHVTRFDEWLESGHYGSMEWMRRGRDRRADPKLLLPEAKSIFCVLLPYTSQPHGCGDPEKGVRYARYLAGPDYHMDIKSRLERALETVGREHPGLQWKICVDTSAVLERTWANLCGLGWIGKNSLLIHPRLGSYTFIGSVLLSEELQAAPRPPANWCGSCERCLTGCPTKAFARPGMLDSRRCISALTLEYRGESLPSDPALSTGNWVAGCDICQEVCPFNLKRARAEEGIEPTGSQPSLWGELLNESESEYRLRIQESALSRVKYPMFRRNLEAALAGRPLGPLSNREE